MQWLTDGIHLYQYHCTYISAYHCFQTVILDN
jgi:hypothetical protein